MRFQKCAKCLCPSIGNICTHCGCATLSARTLKERVDMSKDGKLYHLTAPYTEDRHSLVSGMEQILNSKRKIGFFAAPRNSWYWNSIQDFDVEVWVLRGSDPTDDNLKLELDKLDEIFGESLNIKFIDVSLGLMNSTIIGTDVNTDKTVFSYYLNQFNPIWDILDIDMTSSEILDIEIDIEGLDMDIGFDEDDLDDDY